MGSLESSGTEVATVDVLAAKDLVDSGYFYLDVRTEEEFKNGYPDAGKVLNIPYLFITPQGRVKNLQFLEQALCAYGIKDKIVVGCRSGVRSLDAGIDLVKAGYKQVINMGGGYLSWVEHGLPVKKPVVVKEEGQAKEVVSVQKPSEAGKEQKKNELPVEKPANEVEEQVF
ncbi:thiosulfate sulfurtransferase 18-like [Punica granatum]|uniref:Thiosulfate sulfurtransferase 18-like n=1 Tax=Punica granatum TaxID=22663 RepID=A0A6P8CZC9_PUNGR|nr:thiosulfate sulfurtransferase 18-like [Punica granatum]